MHCIICNNELKELTEINYKFVPGWNKDFSCKIGACNTCFHIQQINPLNSNQLVEYYETESVSKVYERGQVSAPASTINRFDRYINFFRIISGKNFTDSFSWLDVGAHRNHYLNHFSRFFPSTECFGLDFVNPGNEKKFFLRDISKNWWGGLPKFDVISSFHVLEHMHNPQNLFKGASELLDSNGLLILEVPNLENRPLFNANYFYLEHIQYFTDKSLRLLADSCGFSCLGLCAVSPEFDDDHRNEMPVLMAAFARNKSNRTIDRFDSIDDLNVLSERIDKIKSMSILGRKIVLWGSGMHTSFLLSKLDGFSLEICDSSTLRQGSYLGRYKIKSPIEVFANNSNAICVPSSFSGNSVIISAIVNQFPNVEVFNLYEK